MARQLIAAPAAPTPARVREWAVGEAGVFRAALLVALLHGLDDAFLHRQPGVPATTHLVAGLVAVGAAGAAAVGFPRLRPGFAGAVSLAFGVLALVNGAQHVLHVEAAGAEASDVTGVAAAAAGAVLLVLAAAIPFRHRRDVARTRRRRWANRLVAVAGMLVGGLFLLFPVALGIVTTHKYREPVGAPPNGSYRSVAFESADGLRLAGWYVPSRNGAAVVLVHGGGGDRTGAIRHAELLARHGYGVLVYDARGRGESEGSPNALGWGWQQDVAGALDFLASRPDVDAGRIAGLGLSTGADVLIQVAARDRRLTAVVADGATGESFADYRNLKGLDWAAPYWWTMYAATRTFSGAHPGEALKDAVARVAPTPLLLVATGGSVPEELDFNRLYAKSAHEPVELWALPDVGHTAAIIERPRAYERRVVAFLEDAIGG